MPIRYAGSKKLLVQEKTIAQSAVVFSCAFIMKEFYKNVIFILLLFRAGYCIMNTVDI